MSTSISSAVASAFAAAESSCWICIAIFLNRKVPIIFKALSSNACFAVFFGVRENSLNVSLLGSWIKGFLFLWRLPWSEVLSEKIFVWFGWGRFWAGFLSWLSGFAKKQWVCLSRGFGSSVVCFLPLSCAEVSQVVWVVSVQNHWTYFWHSKFGYLGV